MESVSLFHFILSIACLFVYIAVCTIGLVGSYTIYTRYSKASRERQQLLKSSSIPSPTLPGVSILRPLKGLDTQLQECLESAFQQNYPQFEILLSVAEEEDPAAEVARTLIAKYPHIPAKLIIGI
jgi:ceramide glucosyltransferase